MLASRIWLAAGAGLLAALFVTFGLTGYEPPHVDANYLTLPAVAWASGQGFTSPLWPAAEEFDPEGKGRFLYHGPAFPMLVRSLLPAATGAAALLAIHLLNAGAILVFALLLWRLTGRFTAGGVWLAPALVAALAALAAVLMAAAGRPEPLAILLTTLAALLLAGTRPLDAGRRMLPVGVVLGLLGAAHPVAALKAALLLLLWCAVGAPLAQTARLLEAAVAAAALTWLAFMTLLYPFPLAHWLTGMRNHAARQPTGPDLDVLLPQLVAHVLDPFVVGLLIAAAALIAAPYWRRRAELGSPGLVAAAGLLFVAVELASSWSLPWRTYNSFPLVPLAAATVVLAIARPAGRRHGLRAALLLATLVLPALGFARLALLYPYYLGAGTRIEEGRRQFAEVLAAAPGPIGVTPSLWVLSEEYDRLRVNFDLANRDERSGDPLEQLAVQRYHRPSKRGRLHGYCRQSPDTEPEVPRLLGLPLARSVPGYGFDLYRRC